MTVGGPTDWRDSLRQGNLRSPPKEMELDPGLEMSADRGVEKGGTRLQGAF